ncbi:alpha/beta-hydrolase [Exidia glandulosa HHB12029]|uniref:Alpha/beta-hydrolase n=1 Tax=Exidia glandulosa HHB12029 TaxID=1314781 RepID=A0A165E132_EXIGL|nr:alpha/beta-hydrolase [Exidia glandulosa HHB12029]
MAAPYTESWITGPGNTAFYTHTYTPAQSPKAVVVAVHGFIEHIDRFTHVFPQFQKRGILVFAYDQRGFGKTALDTTGKKSKHSAYGKFSGHEQLADLEFFLRHAKTLAPNVPLFLLGHSMGGGEVLSFVTNTESSAPGRDELIDGLAGVIASSPLVAQTTPAPRWKRALGGHIATFLPWMSFPAPVDPTDLCQDKQVSETFANDPLIIHKASLKGLKDMLNRADNLLGSYYQNWPVDLPILIVHGDNDKVASFDASKKLHDKLTANDKTFTPYRGGYHELHNEPEEKDKVIEQWVSWIEAHLERKRETDEGQGVPEPIAVEPAAASDPTPETVSTEPTADDAEGTTSSKL